MIPKIFVCSILGFSKIILTALFDLSVYLIHVCPPVGVQVGSQGGVASEQACTMS